MAVLTIASKNYGSWSLRGWLLCKMVGLEFTEEQAKSDDPFTRAELLLLSPSFLVPCLAHDGVRVWDTLAIAEYLNVSGNRRRNFARFRKTSRLLASENRAFATAESLQRLAGRSAPDLAPSLAGSGL